MPFIENEEAIELQPLIHRVENLREANFDQDKIDKAIKTINDIDKNVQSMKNDPRVADVEGKVSVVTGAVSSITDLISTVQDGGNGFDIADKSTSALNSIAQFGALAGPEGEVVALVVSGITSVVSSILSLTKPKEKTPLEKMQDAITELIKNEFLALEFDELKKEATEEIAVLKFNSAKLTNTLTEFSSSGADYDEATKGAITAIAQDRGVGSLGSLRKYIEDHSVPTKDHCKYVANALLLFSLLAHHRLLELSCLGACYLWKNWSIHQWRILYQVQQDLKVQCQQVIDLVPFSGIPGVTIDTKFNPFVAGLYALGNKKIETILNICAPNDNRKVMGKTVTISNGAYIGCNDSTADRAPITYPVNGITDQTLFVVFDLSADYNDDFVRIFSIGAYGYMFASDAQKVWLEKRQVCVWTPGQHVTNGRWQIDYAKGALKEKGYGEYLTTANDADNKPRVFIDSYDEAIASGSALSGDSFQQVWSIKAYD
mmetsp:Transcript_6270/g.9233  ORF Transcript_6270/g.9233 Transcript_6270/m.9233 type:complete len:488 (+) Transcript_6270:150-1613(+)|eukprot:CAMPEP_0194213468 /NCGR_PEP_ID=MMETSP0156-20130528/14093_1 /TAXON_ID=33649 /ORGANISM="Thalassionema nitzschioides, Strain L26-B" /LENGTH=487 /DNA_ID=CAMNT_0038941509 /DNA_START=76 /DNA_END=1539 /DNA_ORIENTATION=+